MPVPTASVTPSPEPALLNELERLHSRIRQSSNFRFAWQFFAFSGADGTTVRGATALLEAVIADAGCHEFLASTFEAMYEPSFEIQSLHEHASLVPTAGEFESILAAAANDTLGAYSRCLRDATPAEAAQIRSIFAQLGSYHSFQLLPGSHAGCDVCKDHDNHLFSTWFYGVAWDWCFLLTWPEAKRAWIGCLSDTD